MPAPRWHALRVMAVAAALPGMGQVLNGTPKRGLVFVFYIVLLGTLTYQLADPEVSFLGRYAGGLFVYAISVMDAYLWAARRPAPASAGPSVRPRRQPRESTPRMLRKR